MSIILTNEQSSVLNQLLDFIDHSSDRVFILKGAAGSGKTTLVKQLLQLIKLDKAIHLMAPTGRAAKVLRDKTGDGVTIHKAIYALDKLELYETESDDSSKKTFHYFFPLREVNHASLFIVDESSMISSVKSEQELFTFGTGVLLDDLMQVAPSKIIFIGDSAQLPPVGDSKSNALDETYFKDKGFGVQTAQLNTVMRQDKESEILQAANSMRELLGKPQVERSTFHISGDSQIHAIKMSDIPQTYTQLFGGANPNKGAVITFSNQKALEYNRAIRQLLYPNNPNIVEGDLLMIIANNYNTYSEELFNGDIATVLQVSDSVETKKVQVRDRNQMITVTLTFRNVVIKLLHSAEPIKCKIIDSLLNGNERDLSIAELKALYIDFCIRFNNEQKSRRERGEEVYKEGSAFFRLKLKEDPYFNAVRVKYGYAITCHKSQGGEWDTVFVDYAGRIGLFDDAIRWCYTATTRAKETLYTINTPHITPFNKLEFTPIVKVKNVDEDFLQPSQAFQNERHGSDSHIAQRLKYFEITEKLYHLPFTIQNLQSLPYLERYTFLYEQHPIVIDLYYKGSGIFNVLAPDPANPIKNQLIEVLNAPFHYPITVDYEPSNERLEYLYQKVNACCNELDITICNIKEHIGNYYVIYYLLTDGRFSYIQFYFNKKGLSTANPKSDLGPNDNKLNQLIELLSK